MVSFCLIFLSPELNLMVVVTRVGLQMLNFGAVLRVHRSLCTDADDDEEQDDLRDFFLAVACFRLWLFPSSLHPRFWLLWSR